jgi:hypothetical protein
MLTMKSLPKLKTLQFSTSHVHPKALATFWSSPLARRLERVELRPHYGVDGAIIPIAHAEAPAGLAVLVRADGAEVVVQRGKPLVMRAFEPERRTPREQRSNAQLAKDLERFISGFPKSLSLRVEGLPAEVVALVKKRVAKVEVA